MEIVLVLSFRSGIASDVVSSKMNIMISIQEFLCVFGGFGRFQIAHSV